MLSCGKWGTEYEAIIDKAYFPYLVHASHESQLTSAGNKSSTCLSLEHFDEGCSARLLPSSHKVDFAAHMLVQVTRAMESMSILPSPQGLQFQERTMQDRIFRSEAKAQSLCGTCSSEQLEIENLTMSSEATCMRPRSRTILRRFQAVRTPKRLQNIDIRRAGYSSGPH